MKPMLFPGLMLGGLLALQTVQARTPDTVQWESGKASYACADGRTLEAAFLNQTAGESFASISWQGEPVLMYRAKSGSGVRYVDVDEQRGLRFYTKGKEAWLAFMAADDAAKEQVLLRDCRRR